MGVAIIVPGVSFADANLGTVTIDRPDKLYGITIIGPSNVFGTTNATTFNVLYSPTNTTLTGVTWSIVSGGSYASIGASTGVLTVLSGANNNQVVIRATSTHDGEISSEKTINVTYIVPLEDLTNYFAMNSGVINTDITVLPTDRIKAVLSFAGIRNQVVLGSRALQAADDDSTMIEIDSNKFKVKIGGKAYFSANTPVANTKYIVDASTSGVSCSPSVGEFTESTYTFTSPIAICVGALIFGNGTYFTSKFIGNLWGVEIYGSTGELKHRLIPQDTTTLLDEITQNSYTVSSGSVVYN